MNKVTEKIAFHPSWLNYLGHFVIGVIFLGIAVVCFIKEFEISGHNVLGYVGYLLILVIIIVALLSARERFSRTYILTPNNVRSRSGILSRNEIEIKIEHIREIGISQSMIQRILNIGDISFSSASTSAIEIVFKGIRNPVGVKEKINKIQSGGEFLESV